MAQDRVLWASVWLPASEGNAPSLAGKYRSCAGPEPAYLRALHGQLVCHALRLRPLLSALGTLNPSQRTPATHSHTHKPQRKAHPAYENSRPQNLP